MSRESIMRRGWLLVVAWMALGGVAAALDGDEVLKQVDRNLTPVSFESYRKLVNIEPDGSRREFILFTVKKGNDRVASLFLSPASEEGRATLRLGDNMWLYIPDVGKPVRITSLQSVVGGVFNNADVMRLDYHSEYDVEEMEDRGETYLLELKAKTRTVAYDRLKMTVDKEALVPTEIGCYASSGLLIKTLHFEETKEFDDGIRRPSVIETDSPLQKGYRSIMIFVRIRERDVPDEAFTLGFLPRIDSLR
jgi:outer membrane lipoprotein-sorting protein